MNGIIKKTILYVAMFGVSFSSTYYGYGKYLEYSNSIAAIPTPKEQFFDELKNVGNYSLDSGYIELTDEINYRTFYITLKDVYLNLVLETMDIDLEATLDIKYTINEPDNVLNSSYNYMSLNVKYIDNVAYLGCDSNYLGTANISFGVSSISELIDVITKTTFIGSTSDFDISSLIDISAINSMYNTMEMEETDTGYNFMIPIEDLGSSLVLTSDKEFNLDSVYSKTPLKLNDQFKISLYLNHVTKVSTPYKITPPEDYMSVNDIFSSLKNIFTNFSPTEDAKGAAIDIGSQSKPVSVVYTDPNDGTTKEVINAYGNLSIFNSLTKDYILYFNGLAKINFSFIDTLEIEGLSNYKTLINILSAFVGDSIKIESMYFEDYTLYINSSTISGLANSGWASLANPIIKQYMTIPNGCIGLKINLKEYVEGQLDGNIDFLKTVYKVFDTLIKSKQYYLANGKNYTFFKDFTITSNYAYEKDAKFTINIPYINDQTDLQEITIDLNYNTKDNANNPLEYNYISLSDVTIKGYAIKDIKISRSTLNYNYSIPDGSKYIDLNDTISRMT